MNAQEANLKTKEIVQKKAREQTDRNNKKNAAEFSKLKGEIDISIDGAIAGGLFSTKHIEVNSREVRDMLRTWYNELGFAISDYRCDDGECYIEISWE